MFHKDDPSTKFKLHWQFESRSGTQTSRELPSWPRFDEGESSGRILRTEQLLIYPTFLDHSLERMPQGLSLLINDLFFHRDDAATIAKMQNQLTICQ
jgi:hypothetical protein